MYRCYSTTTIDVTLLPLPLPLPTNFKRTPSPGPGPLSLGSSFFLENNTRIPEKKKKEIPPSSLGEYPWGPLSFWRTYTRIPEKKERDTSKLSRRISGDFGDSSWVVRHTATSFLDLELVFKMFPFCPFG